MNAPTAFSSIVPLETAPFLITTSASSSFSSRRDVSPFGAIEDLNVRLRSFGRIIEKICFPVQYSWPPFFTPGGGRSRIPILLRMNAVSSFEREPRPASIGLRSGVRSWPWR